MTEQTIFEKIINREVPADILYEDENVFAFLDAFPIDKGHTLVIPKKPYVHIWDMPEDEYINLQKIVRRLAKQMKEKLGKDVAVFQRNGHNAGQEVMHVHVHLLPRFETEYTKPVFNYAEPGAQTYESSEEIKKFKDLLTL